MICRDIIITGFALTAAFVYQSCVPHLQAVEDKIKVVHGYNYELPKLKKGACLLFQGDSITDMKWGRNQKDRNHYLGHIMYSCLLRDWELKYPKLSWNFSIVE